MACLNCGGQCGHGFGAYDHIGNEVPGPPRGLPGFGQGLIIDRSTDPWDTSQWTITEWAAAAGLVLSIVWVWKLAIKGK